MIEQLFGSKTRVKLLTLFMSNPNRPFYVREITRKVDEQINSVRRELSNLLTIGVITSESTNNRLYYEVNQKYNHYGALKQMFGGTKNKKIDVEQQIPEDETTKQIKSLGAVELALYTGVFTRDDTAPADIMIVGDINKTKLTNFVNQLEANEGRELRYVSMPVSEYRYRRDVNDRFIANILASKKTVIIDKTNSVKE